MHERAPDVHTTPNSRALAHILARYREPNCARGVLELVITAVPFVLTWILMWATLDSGYWICPAARRAGCGLPRAPKDGSIRHVLITSSVQFRDDGFINARCCTLDVTELKSA